MLDLLNYAYASFRLPMFWDAEANFREVTGWSIHEEIDEIRFAKVFELLKTPRRSLDSLPDLCGFKTSVALRKAFSLRTGMSMRDWRKTARG